MSKKAKPTISYEGMKTMWILRNDFNPDPHWGAKRIQELLTGEFYRATCVQCNSSYDLMKNGIWQKVTHYSKNFIDYF